MSRLSISNETKIMIIKANYMNNYLS